MTKNAALWVLLLAIMTILLSSCGGNSASGEGDSETAGAVSESEEISAATTAGTSETVTFCEEDIFSETSGTEAGTEIEAEEPSFPVVIPADEVYEFYPMKIIYSEKQKTEITAERAEYKEKVYYDDVVLLDFSAEYPVFSGGNDSAMKKINDSIKDYIDSVFEEDRAYYEDYTPAGEEEISIINNYGGWLHRTIVGGGHWEYEYGCWQYGDDCYDVNGNILNVYFINYYYTMGAAHGLESPVPMLFDLRTGERIYFSGLIGDNAGLSGVLKDAFTDFQFRHGEVPFGKIDADKYSEILESEENRDTENFMAGDNIEFGIDEDGNYITALNNADERMTVYNGCVGFYLAPYEYGSYADGIRRVDIPASEVIPYLNDKGKALFEGYASGSGVPANVVEYKGGKYFDTTMWIPDIFDRDDPTDGDIEFISLFENARYREYYFEKYGIEKD